MKLITLQQAKELRSAGRIDQPVKHWKCFDGDSWHYYCWLDGIIEWLEKRQASSLKASSPESIKPQACVDMSH